MNTIKRPRKRPRVKSYNLRTLWWVLRREAALHIFFPNVQHVGAYSPARGYVASWPSWKVIKRSERWIAAEPWRRYTP